MDVNVISVTLWLMTREPQGPCEEVHIALNDKTDGAESSCPEPQPHPEKQHRWPWWTKVGLLEVVSLLATQLDSQKVGVLRGECRCRFHTRSKISITHIPGRGRRSQPFLGGHRGALHTSALSVSAASRGFSKGRGQGEAGARICERVGPGQGQGVEGAAHPLAGAPGSPRSSLHEGRPPARKVFPPPCSAAWRAAPALCRPAKGSVVLLRPELVSQAAQALESALWPRCWSRANKAGSPRALRAQVLLH